MAYTPDPYEIEHRLTNLESRQEFLEDAQGKVSNKLDAIFSAISEIKTDFRVQQVAVESALTGIDVKMEAMNQDLKDEMKRNSVGWSYKQILWASSVIGTLVGSIIAGVARALGFIGK